MQGVFLVGYPKCFKKTFTKNHSLFSATLQRPCKFVSILTNYLKDVLLIGMLTKLTDAI